MENPKSQKIKTQIPKTQINQILSFSNEQFNKTYIQVLSKVKERTAKKQIPIQKLIRYVYLLSAKSVIISTFGKRQGQQIFNQEFGEELKNLSYEIRNAPKRQEQEITIPSWLEVIKEVAPKTVYHGKIRRRRKRIILTFSSKLEFFKQPIAEFLTPYEWEKYFAKLRRLEAKRRLNEWLSKPVISEGTLSEKAYLRGKAKYLVRPKRFSNGRWTLVQWESNEFLTNFKHTIIKEAVKKFGPLFVNEEPVSFIPTWFFSI